MVNSVILLKCSAIFHGSAIFHHSRSCQPFVHCSAIFYRSRSCQPFCKIAECGARVVAQSRAHEQEATQSRGSVGGRRLVARLRSCGAEPCGQGAQDQVAWAGRARGEGGHVWLDRSVGRLGPGDGLPAQNWLTKIVKWLIFLLAIFELVIIT
jgi:hypothetical protein